MGGGLPTGGRGSKVYVLCAEPKEHKRFRPGTRPGRIGSPAGRIGYRGDREIVYVPNVYVPFPAPKKGLSRSVGRGSALRRQALIHPGSYTPPPQENCHRRLDLPSTSGV